MEAHAHTWPPALHVREAHSTHLIGAHAPTACCTPVPGQLGFPDPETNALGKGGICDS